MIEKSERIMENCETNISVGYRKMERVYDVYVTRSVIQNSFLLKRRWSYDTHIFGNVFRRVFVTTFETNDVIAYVYT